MPDDYYVSQYSGEEIDDAIARALPGGAIDITLQNKGDTGFGFNGDLNIIVHWDDTDGTKFESSVDTILLGMSRDISKRLKIVDYPACVVDGNGGYADIYSRDDKGNNASCTIVHYAVWAGGKIVIALKQKTDGTWYPWEYVNPPMELGVEYRTTERYLYKPVYAKTIDCGTVPLNTQKIVSMGVSGQLNKIRCNAWASSSSDSFTIPRKLNGTEVTATAASSANNIYISSNTDTLANYTIYATVYYTKATD